MTDQTAPAPKKPKSKKSTAQNIDAGSSRSSLRRESVQNLAKAQKVVADYVAEQTAVAADFVKNRFDLETASPAAAAVEAAQAGVEQLVDAQKHLADWAAQPRVAAEKKSTQGRPALRMRNVPVRGLVRNGLNTVLDGQHELLDLAKAQGNLALDTLSPLARGKFTDMPATLLQAVGKAVENVFASQSRLLDLTTRYAGDTAELLSEGDDSVLTKETADAVQRGTKVTVALQKSLMGIADAQTQSTLDRLNRSDNEPAPVESPAWIDSARDRLDRVTDAQLRVLNRSREWVDRTLSAK